MIKLRASYTDRKELIQLINLLKPALVHWKEKEQRGANKRAYIDIEVVTEKPETIEIIGFDK
ncbi:MAG: hypothetical protein U0M21_01970 [Emergencia sp.]|nr:hypothetical protein [Emergencia sp.]